jgi:hypothetical protein
MGGGVEWIQLAQDRGRWLSLVTYSGSVFTMELHCTPEVNTLQLNTASHSSNTRRRPTHMVSEHSLL